MVLLGLDAYHGLVGTRSKLKARKMLPVVLLIWITSITAVISVFECPDLTSSCSCGDTLDWLDDQWQTLSFVNCSSSGLSRIPDLSPLRGVKIDRLLLKDNNITSIDSRALKHLNLSAIDLSHNPLKTIRDNAFDHIRHKIERLDLGGIKLPIDEGLSFLKGMTNLKDLDLGHNILSTSSKFHVFPPGLFSDLNLASLKTLTLQALLMTKLEPGTFRGIEHLEQLDLSHNFLPVFPTELKKLKNLKKLNLYHNEIMSVRNNSFAGLTQLKTFLIGANDLDTIEPGAFNDLENSLEEINCYYNHLSAVPTEALAGLRKLRKLSLVKNDISSIENGSFVGDYQLERLELDDNPGLSFVDEGVFHGIEESLTQLYIRNLELEVLPLHILRRLPNLYYLDATDNKIGEIDKDFFEGLQLTNIYLMWNKIKRVDARAFAHFQKGITLDLHENLVTNVSFVLEAEPCLFESLYLSHNSIKCDCVLEEVLHSGLVSWNLVGECYTQRNKTVRWYSFQDPALKTKLKKLCNVTTPYSFCNASGADSLSATIPYHVLLITLLAVVYSCSECL